MSGNLKKTCPKCRQQDTTDFSTCRFCGTRYDAKVGKGINERVVVGICGGILLICGLSYFGGFMRSVRVQQYGSITKIIQAANKPRLIEFYASWCPSCQAYVPILVQCETKYFGKIDFQRINTDDPSAREMMRLFQISSIPRTFLFNRKGEYITDFVGSRDYSELDKYLQDPDFRR
jgi:thiol-disulfide isomerase/thioredoxin